MTGLRFGRLVALERADKKGSSVQWHCACDCGTHVVKTAIALRTGKVSSCGCLRSDLVTAKNTKHGEGCRKSRTATYVSWKSMMVRCYNTGNHKYPDYGGRGITVVDSWHCFENFRRDMGPRPQGKTLDRIDVNGHYGPDNCRWADVYQQAQNKRSNVYITHEGKKMCLAEWARATGIDQRKISSRLRYGWQIERVLTP